MNRAVFLDRDGVVNRAKLVNGLPVPPTTSNEVEILDGVIEAIAMLKKNEFVLAIISNQPDVARGKTEQSQVDEINSVIRRAIGVESIYVCPHDDNDFCECRKPSPGLIQRAATELDVDISKSYFVGDRWRDVAASQKAGCQAFFIDYLYPERQPEMPFTRVSSLFQAANLIVRDVNAKQ